MNGLIWRTGGRGYGIGELCADAVEDLLGRIGSWPVADDKTSKLYLQTIHVEIKMICARRPVCAPKPSVQCFTVHHRLRVSGAAQASE